MITTDSNVLFEGVAYNDFEIDLLLKMYGASDLKLNDKGVVTDTEIEFNFNDEV